MRKQPPLLLALLLFLFPSAGRVAAQITVNIEARDAGRTSPYSGQGAFSDPGHNYWNTLTTVSGTSLLASDGVTATTLSFAVSGIDGIGWGGNPSHAYSGLLADYFYVLTAWDADFINPVYTPATFTIGGVTPGHIYDVYLYSQAGSSGVTDRAATFTLQGASKNLTGLEPDSWGSYGPFEQGKNLVVFRVTATGTTLTGSFVPKDTGYMDNWEAELNALQIIDYGTSGPGSSVPEPPTYAALAGLVALGVSIRKLRRRARV